MGRKLFTRCIFLGALVVILAGTVPLLHHHADEAPEHTHCAVCQFVSSYASDDIERPAVLAVVLVVLCSVGEVTAAVLLRPFAVLLSLSPPHIFS